MKRVYFFCLGVLLLVAFFMPDPAAAYYQVKQSDSVTLNAAGDTDTITYSEPMKRLIIDVDGGAIHYNMNDTDATEAAMEIEESDPPFKLKNRSITILDLQAAEKNSSGVTVRVRALN